MTGNIMLVRTLHDGHEHRSIGIVHTSGQNLGDEVEYRLALAHALNILNVVRIVENDAITALTGRCSAGRGRVLPSTLCILESAFCILIANDLNYVSPHLLIDV